MPKDKVYKQKSCISSFCMDYRNSCDNNLTDSIKKEQSKAFTEDYFLEDFEDPQDIFLNEENNKDTYNLNETVIPQTKTMHFADEACPKLENSAKNNSCKPNDDKKTLVAKGIVALLLAFIGVILLALVYSFK